jgi:hypothetical protein
MYKFAFLRVNGRFIVLSRSDSGHGADLFDLNTRTRKSLLWLTLAKVDVATPLQIAIGNHYFALGLGHTHFAIFTLNGEFYKVLLTSFDSLLSSSVAGDELWLATNTKIARRLSISGRTIQTVSFREIEGTPHCCTCLGNSFVVATSSGSVVAIDWDAGLRVFDNIGLHSIVGVEKCMDDSGWIVNDSSFSIVMFSRIDGKLRRIPDSNIKQIKWFDADSALIRMRKKSCFVVIDTRTFEYTSTKLGSVFSAQKKKIGLELLMKSSNHSDFLKNCEHFPLLKSLLHYSNPSEFCEGCFCLNLDRNRLKHFFAIMAKLVPSASTLGNRKLRLLALAERPNECFDLLVTSPSPQDLLKSIVIGRDEVKDIETIVAALDGGGKSDDAVDLLMLSGNWDLCWKLVIRNGDLEMSAFVDAAFCGKIRVDVIAMNLKAFQKVKVLLAVGRREDAVVVLEEIGKAFEAFVLRELDSFGIQD